MAAAPCAQAARRGREVDPAPGPVPPRAARAGRAAEDGLLRSRSTNGCAGPCAPGAPMSSLRTAFAAAGCSTPLPSRVPGTRCRRAGRPRVRPCGPSSCSKRGGRGGQPEPAAAAALPVPDAAVPAGWRGLDPDVSRPAAPRAGVRRHRALLRARGHGGGVRPRRTGRAAAGPVGRGRGLRHPATPQPPALRLGPCPERRPRACLHDLPVRVLRVPPAARGPGAIAVLRPRARRTASISPPTCPRSGLCRSCASTTTWNRRCCGAGPPWSGAARGPRYLAPPGPAHGLASSGTGASGSPSTSPSPRATRALIRSKAPAARVAVVPNGVDMEEFQPGGTTGAGVAFVGGTNPFPNLDALHFFCEQILPHLRAAGGADPVALDRHAHRADQQRAYHARARRRADRLRGRRAAPDARGRLSHRAAARGRRHPPEDPQLLGDGEAGGHAPRSDARGWPPQDGVNLLDPGPSRGLRGRDRAGVARTATCAAGWARPAGRRRSDSTAGRWSAGT